MNNASMNNAIEMLRIGQIDSNVFCGVSLVFFSIVLPLGLLLYSRSISMGLVSFSTLTWAWSLPSVLPSIPSV